MDRNVKDELVVEFQGQAEWRREKAAGFPDDVRNAEAAEIFDKLAATVRDVDPTLLQAYGELWDDIQDTEAHSEMMRRVGFGWWPETAEEFCKVYIADRSGTQTFYG